MLSSLQWFMSFLMLRATDFATASKPFVRERFSWLPPNAPNDFATQLKGALLNAFDLTLNARGIGWNWGKGIYVPPTKPTTRKGPLSIQISHSPLRRNDLQSRSATASALRESDRDDFHLSARALHLFPGNVLPSWIHRDDVLRPRRRSVATPLPRTMDGDQPRRLLGDALAPGVQARLRHLWRQAGGKTFRTGGRRARRILHFRDHARLWRMGRGTWDRAVLRDVLLRYDGCWL